MKMIIVTGMSGSGKTVALKMFEDFGYYCVDNLPVELLLNFVDLTIESERGMKGIALGIDIRSGLNGLQEVFDELSHKKINMEILFLDADDETLIKRYKETRRNHPLAVEGRLIDGINLERERLAFLRERADRILDTGRFLTKELKQELKKIYVDGKSFNNCCCCDKYPISVGNKFSLYITSPEIGFISFKSVFISVDFPTPFSPITHR